MFNRPSSKKSTFSFNFTHNFKQTLGWSLFGAVVAAGFAAANVLLLGAPLVVLGAVTIGAAVFGGGLLTVADVYDQKHMRLMALITPPSQPKPRFWARHKRKLLALSGIVVAGGASLIGLTALAPVVAFSRGAAAVGGGISTTFGLATWTIAEEAGKSKVPPPASVSDTDTKAQKRAGSHTQNLKRISMSPTRRSQTAIQWTKETVQDSNGNSNDSDSTNKSSKTNLARTQSCPNLGSVRHNGSLSDMNFRQFPQQHNPHTHIVPSSDSILTTTPRSLGANSSQTHS